MKIILLPGLDGTGLMFDPFLERAPSDVTLVVIPLDENEDETFRGQAERTVSLLGNDRIILLGESYSGRIAYELCKLAPDKIAHCIFAASFLSNRSFFSRFASVLPLSVVQRRLVPKALMSFILFHNKGSEELLELFYKSVSKVRASTIKKRIRNVASLKSPTGTIDIPCTYIRATEDRIVSKSAVNDFRKVCSTLCEHEVAGGHFILQSNPEDCWQIIMETVDVLDSHE